MERGSVCLIERERGRGEIERGRKMSDRERGRV